MDKEYLILREDGYYIAYADYDNIEWETGEILEKPNLSFRSVEEYRRIPSETVIAIFNLKKINPLGWQNDFSKVKENTEYFIAERYKGKTYYHIGKPWFTNIDYETGDFLEKPCLDSFECTDELIIKIKDVIGFIEVKEPTIF